MTRTRTVDDLQVETEDYRREGYTVLEREADHALVRDRDHGGMIAHIALFFTVGWLTLGLLNVVYAVYRRRQADTVWLKVA